MTTTHQFYAILHRLKNEGQRVMTRGLEVIELCNMGYVLAPRTRFMCFDHRKLKMDYVKQEFLWYLVGDQFDKSITRCASMWKDLVNNDGTINSNYGYYLFNKEASWTEQSNFDRVVETLTADPGSRRATLMILNSDHLNSKTKDYPCTVYINFLIRNGRLNMYVRMRSQDAIYGMGNDAPFFSMVHELMLYTLKNASEQFTELTLGGYHHSADSFHVYERHYEMLDKILEDPAVTVDQHDGCPEMTRFTPHYLDMLRRELKRKNPGLESFRTDPFIDWLFTRDDEASIVMPE